MSRLDNIISAINGPSEFNTLQHQQLYRNQKQMVKELFIELIAESDNFRELRKKVDEL